MLRIVQSILFVIMFFVHHSLQSLLQAARDGREDDVRAWLAAVSDQRKKKLVNAKDKHGFTAVHYAARFNRFKIMQLLLLGDAGRCECDPGNYAMITITSNLPPPPT